MIHRETLIQAAARGMADGPWDAKSFMETPSGEEPDEFRAYWLDKATAALDAILEEMRGMAPVMIDEQLRSGGCDHPRCCAEAMLGALKAEVR